MDGGLGVLQQAYNNNFKARSPSMFSTVACVGLGDIQGQS